MKIALLGLPQAGKKTLFTLLTGRDVPAGRKPGESVGGTARIRDPRVDKLAEIFKPKLTTYAENSFVLCPDVPHGEPSREWLQSARKCDLLCIVIRAFESEAIYHPAGSVDARRDRLSLDGELLLADMEIIDGRLERLRKESRAGLTTEQKTEQEALAKCMAVLEDGKPVSAAALEPQERTSLRSMELVSSLPVLYVYNVAEDNATADFGPSSLPISCLIEQEIMSMEVGDRKEFLDALGLTDTGVDRMNAAAYDALGLMSFYTSGTDECRAWTIRKGSSAPEAGGKIHSDIARGFIRVEVVKFDDFVAAGTEAAARDQGKLQTRGKDYTIEDGDICHFLFSV